MARKIKCDVCSHWHGGFHLCVGPDAPKELRKGATVYSEPVVRDRASEARARWEREWEINRERDQKILKMYMEDMKGLQTCATAYGINKQTVKSIVLRLGGEIRPANVGRWLHNKEMADGR